MSYAPPVPQKRRRTLNAALVNLTLDDDSEAEPYVVIHDDIPDDWVAIKSKLWRSTTLHPGDSVGLHDDEFFRIIHIIRNATTREEKFLGMRLRRTDKVDSLFPLQQQHDGQDLKWYNELCIMMPSWSDLAHGQATRLETVDPRDVVSVREIIFTNAAFPEHSHHRTKSYDCRTKREAREQAQLVCRWKCTNVKNSGGSLWEGCAMRLQEHECDRSYGRPDFALAQEYRSQSHRTMEERTGLAREGQPVPPKKASNTLPKQKQRQSHSMAARVTANADDEVEVVQHKVTETHELHSSSREHGKKRKFSTVLTVTETTTEVNSINDRSPVTKRRERDPVASAQASAEEVIDLESTQYTYGDFCAGIGGTASGAQQAGLKLSFLLDKKKECAKGLRLNFTNHRPKILEETLNDFCKRRGVQPHEPCDVVHASFPCQTHSLAHTVEGKNDDANSASMFGVIEKVIEKCRPRIITMEQSPGIVKRSVVSDVKNGMNVLDKSVCFKQLVRDLTDQGFSVRWEVLEMIEYGVAQKRERMIIIASAPGEPLPEMPKPTHGPGMKSFTRIKDILKVAEEWKDFVPEVMNTSIPRNMPLSSRSVPLQHTITTNNQGTHPSGTRTYTLLEFALFQGFSPWHQFVGGRGDIQEQIGNAVPATFAKLLFTHIQKRLHETDRRYAVYKEPIDLTAD